MLDLQGEEPSEEKANPFITDHTKVRTWKQQGPLKAGLQNG